LIGKWERRVENSKVVGFAISRGREVEPIINVVVVVIAIKFRIEGVVF